MNIYDDKSKDQRLLDKHLGNGNAPLADASRKELLGLQKIAFLERFNVEKLNATTVALTLKPGDSRLDLILAAKQLFPEVEIIDPELLQEWRLDSKFSDPVNTTERIVVNGSVKYGTNSSLSEQLEQLQYENLTLANEHNLAAGFAAFFVAEEKPLIAERGDSCYSVRTACGVFRYLAWQGLQRDFNFHDEFKSRTLGVAGEHTQKHDDKTSDG